MRKSLVIFITTVLAGLSLPSTAQTPILSQAKKPPKLDIKLVPLVPEQNQPTQQSLSTYFDEEGPLRSKSEAHCAAFDITITKLAYQFICHRQQNVVGGDPILMDANQPILILRRDNTQPSWALGADSFDTLFFTPLDKTFKGNIAPAMTLHYKRVVNWLPQRQAPARYCFNVSMNTNNDTPFPGGCHDIASIDYRVKEGRK